MADGSRTDRPDIQPAYRPADAPIDYERDLGDPGSFPFTRGVQPTMYRGRLWTMRQYAGFGTAQETNRRFRHLLDAGQTGLSVAFDLPTQMGIDSDDPRARGEVGRVGVAIDTVEDMHVLLDQIPLDRVSTSMTINATATTLLAMYVVVAEERGIARDALSGTIQNDILKEYIARGTYIYPPEPSLALVADSFRFCAAELPNWNPISISGYHIREAGATAVQELAFTFANGLEYVRQAIDAGLAVDAFAPRLSFFFAAHNDLFEEVAKFRAARRLWARLMRERFGACEERLRAPAPRGARRDGGGGREQVRRRQRAADHPGARLLRARARPGRAARRGAPVARWRRSALCVRRVRRRGEVVRDRECDASAAHAAHHRRRAGARVGGRDHRHARDGVGAIPAADVSEA